MITHCLFGAVTRPWSRDRKVSSDGGMVIGGRTPKKLGEKKYTCSRLCSRNFNGNSQTGIIF